MSRIFKGLALCGAWSCFDEFNRIKEEVLSVIGTSINQLYDVLKSNTIEILFETSHIKVDKNFGIFVTMNPYIKDRTLLPENLEIQFRPVAMIAPDYEIIAEVVFRSEGFMEAKWLAKKIVQMYKLCD